MAKKYDIVNTSLMSATYDGSLIDVEHRAKTDLENGRLVAIDSDGTIRYAVAGDKKVYLHASVEKMYDTVLGLTDFKVLQGELVRFMGFADMDRFETTAYDGVAVKGDKVILGDNGTLKKAGTLAGTENFVAEVLEVVSLGYERYKAIKVRVIK